MDESKRIDIKRAGSRSPEKGSPDDFTGTVWREPVIEEARSTRVLATLVTFEPGARTDWHTHPLGQTLFVISGLGRVQKEGCPIHEIRPGDVAWIPADVKHWHGASPTVAMSHLAIHGVRNGKHIDWLKKKVIDKEYEGEVEPE